MHLIIDGMASNRALLGDVPSVSNWVHKVVEAIGMKVLEGPYWSEIIYPEEDAGVSVIAIISKSHVALHTWTGKSGFNLNADVFSCVPFDSTKVLGLTREYWDLRTYTCQMLPRLIGVELNA